MKTSRFTFLVLSAAACFALATFSLAAAPKVILLVGDGMGPGVMGLGKSYNDVVLKRSALNMVGMMNDPSAKVSLVEHYSASHMVTDSAAAATAMATGRKTYNTAISVDDKGNPLRSVSDEAMSRGMSVGLVTTCEVVDATPAGFSAHASERADKEEIARGQTQKKIDLIMGGGGRYFDNPAGYKIFYEKKDLKKISALKAGDKVLGLFNQNEMNYVRTRMPTEPSLPDMTKAALDFLSKNDKGFFLLVEGGRIDHAAHANSAEDLLEDFMEFDEAIGVVLEYRRKNPDTSVLLMADHDTGGVSLTQRGKDSGYPSREDFVKDLKGIYWTSRQHTSIPVVLTVLPPASADAPSYTHGGFIDNTEIHGIILKQLGIGK
jgi:alkaline phosphatase